VLSPEGDVKETMYTALRTSLSLDDALDLLEIDEVGRSWRAASLRNEDRISDEIKRRRERQS